MRRACLTLYTTWELLWMCGRRGLSCRGRADPCMFDRCREPRLGRSDDVGVLILRLQEPGRDVHAAPASAVGVVQG